MIIKNISIFEIQLTSHHVYRMSDGKTADALPSIIIRLDTDTGLSGWGEVCPLPHYLPAYPGGVIPAIEEMAPVLIGADPVGPEALMNKLDAYLQGHPYAKSAIDTALWDLTAQAAGLPLYRLLGGLEQTHMPLYHSITCIAPEEMAKMAVEAYDSGIRQFQVKLGADNNWEADVARMCLVREAVGDGPLVYGDWNNGSTPLDATRTARQIAHLDVMLEQPCVTIDECAAVKSATGLPMKLDEGAYDMASLMQGHAAGCMDAVAIKLSKFGGLSACRRARDFCQFIGTKMCIEDTWGSDITTTAALHLGASTKPRYLLNVCDLSGYVAPRLDENGPTRADGKLAVPHKPGLGITPDPDILGQPVASF